MLLALSLHVAACVGPTASGERGGIEAGRRLAHDWQKGNCLACHKIPGDARAETSADIGPPLQDIKARFPDRNKLRAQIWDARGANPDTVMPPFGAARILSKGEIDKIVEYLYAY
jgi:sulfur-oxidizing protein SoxX